MNDRLIGYQHLITEHKIFLYFSAEGGADDIIFEDFARLRLKGEGDDQD